MEKVYEFWKRLKRLCESCPHHLISEQLQLQYFYECLNNMDKSIIDAASGGALEDMTPFQARGFIEKMASNSLQFNARSSDAIVVKDEATKTNVRTVSNLKEILKIDEAARPNARTASNLKECLK
ncbi:hypothetical protein Lal_00008514 [Lupinus albus]|nr:hypothetical protein Lal_00008514 [Lupinus albus]